MPEPSNAQPDTFDRLLVAMPRIAEAVNQFKSEKNQRAALEALIRAVGVPADTQPIPEQRSRPEDQGLRPVTILDDARREPESPIAREDDPGAGERQGKRTRKSTNGKRKSITIPKGLNFAPDGHPPLEEFVRAKQPRTQHEKNLLACYYLTEFMGISDVEVGHVLAVYVAAGWDAPKSPDNALRLTASKTHWIDTADSSSIKVVWAGQHHITTKMPGEPKGTKSA